MTPPPPRPINVPPGLDLVYADEALLVLNKPAGLLSVPGRGPENTDCLSARAQALYPDALVVHRLDMSTSGLLVMARGAAAQRTLSRAFADRLTNKTYLAMVAGHPTTGESGKPDWNLIDMPLIVDWPNRPRSVVDPIHGKPSQTLWRVLSLGHTQSLPCALLELQPITGRSHQLRVHLQALGHPILGDELYATAEGVEATPRLMLHASRIALPHPTTQQTLVFESPPVGAEWAV